MPRNDPNTSPRSPHADAEQTGKARRRPNEGNPVLEFPRNPVEPEDPEEHEGATEQQIGDSTGPGAGYDGEPEETEDRGGVS